MDAGASLCDATENGLGEDGLGVTAVSRAGVRHGWS